MSGTIWILVGLVAVAVWMDGYGEALCRESDLRCYELNEKYRKEAGKEPIPWDGSMKEYIKKTQTGFE